MGSTQPIVAGGLLRDAALMLASRWSSDRLPAPRAWRYLGISCRRLDRPSVLGFVRDPESIQRVAKSACVLLFIVGLELQPSRLWACAMIFSGSAWSGNAVRRPLSVLPVSDARLSPEASLAIGCRWRCRRPRRCSDD